MKLARKEILIRVREAAEMTVSIIRSKAQAERALDWGREQNARLRQRLPESEAIEAWVRTNAERFGRGKRPASSSLEHLEQVLTETVSAILQKSERRGRIAVNAIVGKLGGVAVTGGIARAGCKFWHRVDRNRDCVAFRRGGDHGKALLGSGPWSASA